MQQHGCVIALEHFRAVWNKLVLRERTGGPISSGLAAAEVTLNVVVWWCKQYARHVYIFTLTLHNITGHGPTH